MIRIIRLNKSRLSKGQVIRNWKKFEGDNFFGKSMVGILIV